MSGAVVTCFTARQLTLESTEVDHWTKAGLLDSEHYCHRQRTHTVGFSVGMQVRNTLFCGGPRCALQRSRPNVLVYWVGPRLNKSVD